MNCAICYGRELEIVLDMGEMALAGAFLKPDGFASERFYPLRLAICRGCHAVQVADRIEPESLFGRYFYRSSASSTGRAHFGAYADEILQRFQPRTVVEVGCNDGVMLKPMRGMVDTLIGVDPNATIAFDGIEVWRERFTEKTAKRIGYADVVIANNVFAHVESIHEITRAARRLIGSHGVFVLEVHYLGSVLEGQYDAIYHEHVFYHSLIGLQAHLRLWGMRVFDVKRVGIHGGSLRVYVCAIGAHRPESEEVWKLEQEERSRCFHKPEAWQRLELQMLEHRRRLMEPLNRLRRERAKVVGYGAAGRANTLMQWCGMEEGHLAYVVDDGEAKHGFYTPGTHFEIKAPGALAQDRPDFVLVLAWTYLQEIAGKVRQPLIVPFPSVDIVSERLAA